MGPILAVTGVFILLVLNELLWHGRAHGEVSRKFAHISVGTFVAFWPLWLSWTQIIWLGIAMAVVVLVSRQFGIFKAIHSVTRPTWGEIYFGLAVAAVPLITQQPAIFTAAILYMSLADGLAAMVGHKFGHKIYHVFGARKSIEGTLAFMVVSLVILLAYGFHQEVSLGGWLVIITLVAAALENLSPRGLDNLTLPLGVALLLSLVG